jgi:hypothetical protein
LGSPAFVNINIHRLPSGSLVTQHISENAPTGIKHGLRHASLGQLGGTYVADRYKSVLSRNPAGLLVEVVASRVGDLRLNSANTVLVSGTLGNRQFGLILPVVLKGGNLVAVTEGGEFFQAKVDPDDALSKGQVVRHFASKGHIPPATSIFYEGPALKFAFYFAAAPKSVAPLEIGHGGVGNFDVARDERSPTQGSLSSKAGSETGANSMSITALHELSADGGNGVRVNTKADRTPSRELNKVECGQWADSLVASPTTISLALCGDAEVPHLIAGDRIVAKLTLTALDTKFEGDNAQSGPVLSHSGLVKSALSGRRPVARSPF